MPLYTFYCEDCDSYHEILKTIEKRDEVTACPNCESFPIKRQVDRPLAIFIDGAGVIANRTCDEFWNRAEKKKQKEIGKKLDTEKEKIKYNDKATMQGIENTINNQERNGNMVDVKKAEKSLKI